MAAALSSFSFSIPFDRVATTTQPLQNIRETLYFHIKKVEQFVPEMLHYLLSNDLKDLTEASTTRSRSIAIAEVGVKVEIKIEHSGEISDQTCTSKGEQISINHSSSSPQDRKRFLLSLKGDPEIKASIEQQIQAEVQKQLETHLDTSKDYRLLHKFIIEEDLSESEQLLGIAPSRIAVWLGMTQPESIPSFDECHKRLMAKIDEHPTIVYAMANHAMTGGRSQICHKFYSELLNFYIQNIKSCRDRVKNLEHLFKKAVDATACAISNGFDMTRLKSNNLVEVILKEASFGVGITSDGFTMTTTALSFPV